MIICILGGGLREASCRVFLRHLHAGASGTNDREGTGYTELAPMESLCATLNHMDRFAELRSKVTPLLRPYVRRISVFGSYARGEATQESDIDLLVELKPSEARPVLGLFEFIRLEDALKKTLGREVDLITEGGLNPRRRPSIERDMVVLYEED